MFRKNEPSESSVVSKKISPSVISGDVSLIGNLISDGLIDFGGTINGNITCHTLIIRGNGSVNGEIRAENVQVSGKVVGTIRARSVTLKETANVEGTVMHEQIVIEDGAIFDGKLKKTNKLAGNVPGSVDSLADMDDLSPETSHRLMENIRLIANN